MSIIQHGRHSVLPINGPISFRGFRELEPRIHAYFDMIRLILSFISLSRHPSVFQQVCFSTILRRGGSSVVITDVVPWQHLDLVLGFDSKHMASHVTIRNVVLADQREDITALFQAAPYTNEGWRQWISFMAEPCTHVSSAGEGHIQNQMDIPALCVLVGSKHRASNLTRAVRP